MLLRVSRVTACLLLLLSASAPALRAQVNNASVTGLVTDATGAVVTGASVTLKNKATNVETTGTTDSSGYYTFATVPIGEYTVTVERQGFKRVVVEGVKLEVGQKARVDAALEAGALTRVVNVPSTTLLATQEAAPGGVIENKLVEQLPMTPRGVASCVVRS